ncbi:MAG: phosphotransferase [Pseudomonadota bacterium]
MEIGPPVSMPFDPDQREQERRDFLAGVGWGDALRSPLSQDASTRRYERLNLYGTSVLLMDAPKSEESPPCPPDADEATRNALGWNAQSRLASCRVEAFAAISRHLRGLGLSAPAVPAMDMEGGFAIVEDMGDAIFAPIIREGEDEVSLYRAAAETLAVVHQAPTPDVLGDGDEAWPILDYDRLALAVNADLFPNWAPHLVDGALSDADWVKWERARDALIALALDYPRAFILRDYHAENLIWLPRRNGPARVGLLDFQDAVNGWPEWDFAMLLQDARREVSVDAHEAAVRAYLDAVGGERAVFDERLAVLGLLNALRVAGIFSRLIARDGKPRYRDFLPRQLQLLSENLTHPAVAEMRAFVDEVTPGLRMRA